MKKLAIQTLLVATVLFVQATNFGGGHSVVGSPDAQQISYTFTDIDVPFPDATTTYPRGINNSGEIVGWYNPGFHGFLADAGEFTAIKGTPSGISADGQIVGSYADSSGAHGFLFDDGVFSTINVPFPGAFNTTAQDINARGEIVGNYRDSNFLEHGYLLSEGEFTTIDVPFPGAMQTEVFGINARGQIVGAYLDGNGWHAFFADKGNSGRGKTAAFSRIQLPFADVPTIYATTYALGINDRGQIVGFYSDANRNDHGFLIDRGQVSTIDVPGALYTQADDINDRGEIVGTYSPNAFAYSRGFIATPHKKNSQDELAK